MFFQTYDWPLLRKLLKNYMTVRQDYLIKPLLNIYTEIYSESSDSESVQEKDPDSVQVQGDSDVESKVQNIGKML